MRIRLVRKYTLNILDFPVAQTVSICLQCERPGFDPWVGKIPWEMKWQPTPVLLVMKIQWTEELGAGYYPESIYLTISEARKALCMRA